MNRLRLLLARILCPAGWTVAPRCGNGGCSQPITAWAAEDCGGFCSEACQDDYAWRHRNPGHGRYGTLHDTRGARPD